MWLSRLDLLAFGKFTDVRLDLGPGFHLVYGPNEAGKSTTLRAIRQLLFGFDERTPDNFLHANPNLRIGGVVSSEPDIELKIIRRKARKDSLRGEDDDTVIDLDRWNQLLSGVDETTFRQRYGIDYEQLVEGGHQIATGSGDLGEILFATGSGVLDLNSVRKGLTDEAEEIFKPQGKKQRLNQALARWQELKDQVREKLLSVSAWEEADRLRQETLFELDRVSVELLRQESDRDQYHRWQQAWPYLREIDSLEPTAHELKSVPRLKRDFADQRREAGLLLKQAATYENAALEVVQRAEQELESLVMPRTLVDRTDELSRFITEWGSCQKGNVDRQKLIEQHNRHQVAISDLRKTFENKSTPLPEPAVELDRPLRTQLGVLGRQQAGLIQALEHAETHHQRVIQQLEQAKLKLSQIPETEPLEEFRSELKRIQSDGDLEERLEQVQQELAVLRDDMRQLIDQLKIGDRSIEDVLQMQVPKAEILKPLESEFQANEAERSLLSSRLADLAADHHKLDQQIESLRREFQIPTEADLAAARIRRADFWAAIRNDLKSGSIPDERALDAYERSLNDADQISDRLREEADRVAQLAEELANFKENEDHQHDISIRLAALNATRIALKKRWDAEWPGLNEMTPAPGQIQAWLTRRDAIVRNEELARRRESEAKTLADRIQQNIGSLARFLGIEHHHQQVDIETTNSRPERIGSKQLSFGWDPDSEDSNPLVAASTDPSHGNVNHSLKGLLTQAEETLTLQESIEQSRRKTMEAIARLADELSESNDQVKKARSKLSQWKIEWQTAMLETGLPSDSSPEAADAFIEALSELTNHQNQARQLQDRISGIETDFEQFEARLRRFCQEIAPDLLNRDVAEAMTSLRDRLITFQREEATRHEQIAKKTQAEKQLILARESQTRGERLVAELCLAAGLKCRLGESATSDLAASWEVTLQQLESIEKQAQDRDRVEAKLEQVRARLKELAREESLAAFTDQVRLHSSEELSLKLLELEQEIGRLAAERDRLNQQLGGVDARLRQMDGGSDAAEAEESRQQCLAQIRADAEDYIRLKLASSILHSSIERYREQRRGPVLTVASELFRELTLGSFAGLRVDEDDSHKPVLVGVRPGGQEAVGVSGMSEGTCDQLYLALRLASLQQEAPPRCHLPLIIDDILIQFDDERATAALRILVKLAKQRQVIFFTHHEHLLELASKHLPGEFAAHRLGI